MTTANIQSLKGLGIIRKADAAAKAQNAVMVVISGKWVMQMLQSRRTRRHLAQLSDHLLADIGLTEEQRQAELLKPFWKIQGLGR
ncbi:DUF1127 domain-containing protein [Marinobacter confluentis]|nr:DUF1127 domain-containing protein [Marinobacter confluentis]